MPKPSLSEQEKQDLIERRKQYQTTKAMADDLGLSRQTLSDQLKRARATSTLYDSDGEVILTWIKEDRKGRTTEDLIVAIKAAFDGYPGPATLKDVTRPERDIDRCTLYPLADWHLGLLAWRGEVGKDYDLKIAKATIEAAMTRLISEAPPSSKAVLIGLGDLLHSDGYANETFKGTAVDVDGRYPKILEAATTLIIKTVDLALQKHDTVDLRILPGNHDEQSAIAVTLALSLFYKQNPRVSVDIDSSRFWWWSWGKVFLGATHGDKAKMQQLPLIMATRNPEMWGKSRFRYIWTGHIHTDTAKEINGVKVESMQSPVAGDAWHHSMGYGSNRSVNAITYHKEQGEVSRQKVNIL